MTALAAVMNWMGVTLSRWPKDAVAREAMPSRLVKYSRLQIRLVDSPCMSMPVSSVKPKSSR